VSTVATGSLAGLVMVGTVGFSLLCLSRAIRYSDDFYGILVRHLEAQRRLNRQAPVPAECYQQDRHAVSVGLLVSGWLVLGLGLLALLQDLLGPSA